MTKKDIQEGSATYIRKETGTPDGDPVSFLAAGMGTRISAAADLLGTRKSAAQAMRVSPDALQRYIREENSASFEAIAHLCQVTGVRMEWIAFNEPPMMVGGEGSSETAAQSDSQAVRLEELTIAIQLVDEALEGKTLETPKRAELVALVYEGLIDGLPEAKVLRWARAASK